MSDMVNDEVEQAFREGYKKGCEQAEIYKDILRETLPILKEANFFPNYELSKEADDLYDRIKKAIAR